MIHCSWELVLSGTRAIGNYLLKKSIDMRIRLIRLRCRTNWYSFRPRSLINSESCASLHKSRQSELSTPQCGGAIDITAEPSGEDYRGIIYVTATMFDCLVQIGMIDGELVLKKGYRIVNPRAMCPQPGFD